MKVLVAILALAGVLVATSGCGSKSQEEQTKQATDYKAEKNDK